MKNPTPAARYLLTWSDTLNGWLITHLPSGEDYVVLPAASPDALAPKARAELIFTALNEGTL